MKTAMSILSLAGGLFCSPVEGSVKIASASDGTCTISVVPQADVEVYIKQSTTEIVTLPNESSLSYFGGNEHDLISSGASTNRWMSITLFRSYWDYRDTAYMIDALHFLAEKFSSDILAALESNLSGRALTNEQRSQLALKILEQQTGKVDKISDSSIDDEWSEYECGEVGAEEGENVLGLGDIAGAVDASEECEEGLDCDGKGSSAFLDLIESDNEIDSYDEESVGQHIAGSAFSPVIDFYHIILHRIALLLAPEGVAVSDMLQLLEADLIFTLQDVIRNCEKHILEETDVLDKQQFTKMQEVCCAIFLSAHNFLHEKLRQAWAPTLRIVDSVIAKTGKNLYSLSYFDFEQWLREQQQ